jgi:malonyl-CoA O-methyltransferase
MYSRSAIMKDFGAAAERYDAHASLQHRVRDSLLGFAEPYFGVRARLLDLGCGTGALSRETLAHERQWCMINLDMALGMCRKASQHALAMNADANWLPLADQCMEGIFSSLMLQWADNPDRIFSEITRVTRPGGYAALSTFVTGTLCELEQALASIGKTTSMNQFMEPHAVIRAASRAGLALVSARQKAYIEYKPDVISLMRSLKSIGAANKRSDRARGLLTPRQLAAVEAAYRNAHTQRGIPASWEVLYLIVKKV